MGSLLNFSVAEAKNVGESTLVLFAGEPKLLSVLFGFQILQKLPSTYPRSRSENLSISVQRTVLARKSKKKKMQNKIEQNSHRINGDWDLGNPTLGGKLRWFLSSCVVCRSNVCRPITPPIIAREFTGKILCLVINVFKGELNPIKFVIFERPLKVTEQVIFQFLIPLLSFWDISVSLICKLHTWRRYGEWYIGECYISLIL